MTNDKTQADTNANGGAYRLLGFLSVLWATGVLLVHTPAQIYSGNAADFTFSLGDLLWEVAPVLAAIPLLLSLPLLLPWPRFRRAWAVGWFALAAVVWVSSSFLVLDIGPLDGRLTRLEVPLGFTLLSLGVLLAVAAGSVLLARRLPVPAALAALVLNGMLLGTSWSAVASGKKDAPPPHHASMQALLRFSESRNALVILLDSLQSDVFEQVIAENPAYRDKLDGFQFFPDTVGPSPSTYLSLPVIHSGKVYDAKRTLPSVYVEDIQHGSFLVALADEGFETSLLNPVKLCPDRTLCANEEIILAGSRAAIKQEYLRLFDFSMLRAAPIQAKRLVFNGGAWRGRNWIGTGAGDNYSYRGQRVLQVLGDRAYVSGTKPVARFIHTLITHLPITLDVNCRPLPRPSPVTRKSVVTQARCAIEAVTGLLDNLKRLDIYDKTTIIILADHGFSAEYAHALGDTNFGFANPVLLFKGRGHRGSLKFSSHPAHSADVPAMLCSDLEACPGFCQPLSGLDAPANRRRVHHHYFWQHNFWELDRIPGLKGFTISGPVRSPASWSRSPKLYVHPEQRLKFISGSGAEQYLDWGWSALEQWGVWSVSNIASISFDVPEDARNHPLRMVAKVRSYLNPKRRELVVKVRANGVDVGLWEFDSHNSTGERECVLTPDVWSRDGGVGIQFYISSPTVPAAYGTSSDQRLLGIGLESLVLERM